MNNKISADEVKKTLKIKTDAAGPEWKSIIEMSIDKCVGEGNAKEEELKKKIQGAPYNIKGINPVYASVAYCITNEIFMGCPESSQDAGMSK